MDFKRCIFWVLLAFVCFIHFGCAKDEVQPLATPKGVADSENSEAETKSELATISGVIEPADVAASIHLFQNGNEISGINVKLESDGKFSFQTSPGRYDLKISADDFKEPDPIQVEAVSGKITSIEKITLKRLPPSPPLPPGGEPQQQPAPVPVPPVPAQVIGPEAGQTAPDFSLEDVNNKKVSLANYKGKKIVLLSFHRGQF